MASRDDTSVVVEEVRGRDEGGSPGEDLRLDHAGDVVTVTAKGDVTHVTSSKPVLVVQVLRTMTANDGAMVVIPPVSQFKHHDVVVFGSRPLQVAKQLVLYTVNEEVSDVIVNDVARPFDVRMQGVSVNVSYVVVDVAATGSVWTEVKTAVGGRFGGYMSNLGMQESITALAHGFRPINTVKHAMHASARARAHTHTHTHTQIARYIDI